LTTAYSAQDMLDVELVDLAWVDQAATLKYSIHQYKNYADTTPEENKCFISWVGKTTNLTNPVVMQIYNQSSSLWETIAQAPDIYDSPNATYDSISVSYDSPSENVDFYLSASIPDLTNYKNSSGVVSHRIYQLES
jgi:hypothetical protein